MAIYSIFSISLFLALSFIDTTGPSENVGPELLDAVRGTLIVSVLVYFVLGRTFALWSWQEQTELPPPVAGRRDDQHNPPWPLRPRPLCHVLGKWHRH